MPTINLLQFALMNNLKARISCSCLNRQFLAVMENFLIKKLRRGIVEQEGWLHGKLRSGTSALIINAKSVFALSDSFYKWDKAFSYSPPNGVNLT